jgi:hypothetical protein
LLPAHVRSQQHIRLLALGYIQEHMIDPGNVLIVVTRARYAALGDGPTAA